MGIRFYCRHCEKRLNVKARQAGEICICPDCEKEIQIPLVSTILLPKKRKKKRRRKKSPEPELSPASVVLEASSIGVQSNGSPASEMTPPTITASVPPPVEASTAVESAPPEPELPVEPEPFVPSVESVTPVEAPAVEPAPAEPEPSVAPEPSVPSVDPALSVEAPAVEPAPRESEPSVAPEPSVPSVDSVTPSEAPPVEPPATPEPALTAEAPTTVTAAVESTSSVASAVHSEPMDAVAAEPEAAEPEASEPEESFVESVQDNEVDVAASEASITDDELLDSSEALNELLSDDEREIPDDTSPESESFLLSKPVAKIGSDPLKSNPDLVWILRHKRLGEKGPLKAREVEEMLENNQLRPGFIVWRQDWDDWLPIEEVFPQLAAKTQSGPAYEIPAELNPHSEVNRKRRARKWIWMCCSAAAFLLVAVLVYCLAWFSQ